MLDGLSDWVTNVIETLGYAGVAFLVALESIFPPIPSEIVLPFAGYAAARGDFSVVGMIIAATVGSVIGSLVLYGLAAWIGPDRLHRFVERKGRWFGLKPHDMERAEAWFDRRASAAVLLGRCVPLIRSVVSVPAGFRRMPLLRFTLLSALGSLVWNVALVSAGAVLGDRYEEVGGVVSILQTAVIVLIVAGLVWFVWTRFIRPRLAAAGDLPPEDSELDV